MTSKERVRAAIAFAGPDRAPRDLWMNPYIGLFMRDRADELLSRFPVDFATIGARAAQPGDMDARDKYGAAGTYRDEWGSLWRLGEPGVIGEVKEPAIREWRDLAHFKPPWDTLCDRDTGFVNAACAATDKFTLSGITARPFERLQFVRGTENILVELACRQPELFEVLRMIHEFYLQDVAWWAQTDVDGIFMMDDWGSARALLISPDMWREIFKPMYREYCDIIHGAGKAAFFHSDGHIEAIYADFIEIGVDAINSQLFCMNIERLAEQYKGRVTFWGEIDRQHVLPFGPRDEVRDAVLRVRRALDDPAGGIIAQCCWGQEAPIENIAAVFETWSEPAPERVDTLPRAKG